MTLLRVQRSHSWSLRNDESRLTTRGPADWRKHQLELCENCRVEPEKGTLRTSSRDVTFKIHGLSGGECKGPPLRANSGLAFGVAGHRNFLQRLVRVSSVSIELLLGSATGSASHFVVGPAIPKATGYATSLEAMSSTQSNTVQSRIQPVRFAPTSLNSRAYCVQKADAPRRPRVPKGIRHATSLTAGAQPTPQKPK